MISIILIALPLLLSPGPGYLATFAFAARFGLSNIVKFLFGIIIVYAIISVLIGMFVLQITNSNTNAINIIQILGGIFIIFLSIRLARRNECKIVELNNPGFVDGVIIQLLNAKYIAVVITIFSSEPEVPLFVTASIITFISVSGLLIYSLAGSLIHDFLTSEKLFRLLEVAFSMLLFIVGIWLIIQSFIEF